MGHEIAMQIKLSREEGRKLAIILPVGPMGMYKWATYFLNEWKIKCDHVTTFNMDEWADGEGNTLSSDNPASFEYSMKEAFFNKLNNTIPESLPAYYIESEVESDWSDRPFWHSVIPARATVYVQLPFQYGQIPRQ